MKLAFSSSGCPDWDLPTMVAKAKEYGYDGIELGGPIADPGGIVQLLRQAELDLVCLATSVAFDMPDANQLAAGRVQVRDLIGLAADLRCPFVRAFSAEPSTSLLATEIRGAVIQRITEAFGELAAYAAERRVTLLVENGGDFADSASIWHLIDAADSHALKCCWNPLAAAMLNERPTRSIPRLNTRIGLVRLTDRKFVAAGAVGSLVPLGQGDVEIKNMIQLLKGIAYRGYLVVDWTGASGPALASPEEVLPAAATYLRSLLDEKPVILTAYKTDKFKPRQGFDFAVGE